MDMFCVDECDEAAAFGGRPAQPSQNKQQTIKARDKRIVLLRFASTFSKTKAGFLRNMRHPSGKDIGGPRVQVRKETVRTEGYPSQIPEDGDPPGHRSAGHLGENTKAKQSRDNGRKFRGIYRFEAWTSLRGAGERPSINSILPARL